MCFPSTLTLWRCRSPGSWPGWIFRSGWSCCCAPSWRSQKPAEEIKHWVFKKKSAQVTQVKNPSTALSSFNQHKKPEKWSLNRNIQTSGTVNIYVINERKSVMIGSLSEVRRCRKRSGDTHTHTHSALPNSCEGKRSAAENRHRRSSWWAFLLRRRPTERAHY